MSAFIVDKAHVDAIVAVAVRGPSGEEVSPDTAWHGVRWDRNPDAHWSDDDKWARADYADADRLGAMLWSENVRSVEGRYPDTEATGDYPGPVDFTVMDVAGYSWPMSTPRLNTVAALKALDGYEYQACEHAEWPECETYRFCDALRRELIGHLPGYRDAAWSIQSVDS